MGDFTYDHMGWILVALIIALVMAMIAVTNKQNEDQKTFMAECRVDHKKYECDVFWGQTDASKQVRDATLAIGAGAAIGAMAGRK